MDMEITALRPRRRFTVEDHYRMGNAGNFGADDRVELIEGEIVEMPPIGPSHGGYARAGIRGYWIVDLDGGRLEVHRDPSPEGYRVWRELRAGERMAPEAVPDAGLALADIIGKHTDD